MSSLLYYILCGVLTLGVLAGIALMGRVRTAVAGNALSALCTAAAILLTLYQYNILSDYLLWAFAVVGLGIGMIFTLRVKMIEMPQMVALLNGLGGAASAVVAAMTLTGGGLDRFSLATAGLALAVGTVTLAGSLVAAGKLHRLLPQRPVVLPAHRALTVGCLVLTLGSVAAMLFLPDGSPLLWMALVCFAVSALFGVVFAIRVGGADMPITISLLNSLSGVAGAIAGMAISDVLLVAVGGVVGASGLLLTQVMCRAMNRPLSGILLGGAAAAAPAAVPAAGSPELAPEADQPQAEPAPPAAERKDPGETAAEVLREAQSVIIIPGYGMALAQAQALVKTLADRLEGAGKEVLFAIHPVAGRMPGHMNVLLAEADIPYEKLWDLETANPRFAGCDAALIVGANDVVNPAANTAEGTPIYGMPVLNAEQAARVIVCNYDLKPGYAGVENPLYAGDRTILLLGDAKETLAALIEKL